MAFSLRHPDLNILISFPKFGILDQTHLLSILIHEKHSRGIFFFNFYSQLLKRAVYFLYNTPCYIQGENKNLVHQNH